MRIWYDVYQFKWLEKRFCCPSTEDIFYHWQRMAVTYGKILGDLKKGQFAPVYVLHGEELFFIDQIVDYIAENALQPAEKAFNQVVWYGKDVDGKMITDEARQYPMMSQRRVIIVKEAQSMSKDDLQSLEVYMSNPTESTILVIAHPHKKVDGRSKFLKEAARTGVVFESKKLRENQMADWIQDQFNARKLGIDPAAIDALIELQGNELSRLKHAFDKLANTLQEGERVTTSLVLDTIGASREYNVFELQRALGQKDHFNAVRIVEFFCGNIKSHPPFMIIGVLYAFYNKLLIVKSLKSASPAQAAKALGYRSEYFVKEYIAAAQHYSVAEISHVIKALRKYDMQLKGLEARGVSHEALLKQMTQEILNIKQVAATNQA